jgi:hypothetical protein
VILAIIFLNENKDLGWGFVLGVSLIGTSVALHSIGMLPAENKLKQKLNLKRLFIRK